LQTEIDNCAKILVRECFNLAAGETFAVIAEIGQDRNLLDAISRATSDVGAKPLILQYTYDEKKPDPPRELVEKLGSVDAILLATTVPFDYEHLRTAQENGARIITASRVTLESYLRVVPIDYDALSAQMHRIGKLIENSSTVRIEDANGTSFEAKIAPFGMRYATSIVRKKSDRAYLPAGTTGIGLVEGSAEGTFVADGIIVDVAKINPPITFVIKKGKVVETYSSDRKQLEIVNDWLRKDKGADAVVEIGIGFNPNAILVSEPEGERVLGSVHIGTGDDIFFGGRIKSQSHLDIVNVSTTLYSDDRPLIRKGEVMQV
jgi:leucyl aminopeptidase (aminopeptidase T)